MTDLTGAWDCLTTTSVLTTLSGRGGAVHACVPRNIQNVTWVGSTSDQLGYGFDLHRRQRTQNTDIFVHYKPYFATLRIACQGTFRFGGRRDLGPRNDCQRRDKVMRGLALSSGL
jgi:hypothetical protein